MMAASSSCSGGDSGPVVILGKVGWTYPIGNHSYLYSIQETSDGGFIATGTVGPSGGSDSVWLLKIDSTGGKEWERTFLKYEDGIGEGRSVWQTSDGGFAVISLVASTETGEHTWLIKTDAEGNPQWDKVFDLSEFRGFDCGLQADDGGYMIVGHTYPSEEDERDAWLVKTDCDANVEWNKTFDAQGCDSISEVRQTTDGGFIGVGISQSCQSPSSDISLIKIDAEGNRQWSRTFDRGIYDYGFSVEQTDDGGYLVLGETTAPENDADIWLIKTDAEGNNQWERTFGGSDHDSGTSIRQIGDGGYIIVGMSDSYGAYGACVWLFKIDPEGNKKWEIGLGSALLEFWSIFSISQTSDGGYVMCGMSQSPSSSSGLIIRTDSEGVPEG